HRVEGTGHVPRAAEAAGRLAGWRGWRLALRDATAARGRASHDSEIVDRSAADPRAPALATVRLCNQAGTPTPTVAPTCAGGTARRGPPGPRPPAPTRARRLRRPRRARPPRRAASTRRRPWPRRPPAASTRRPCRGRPCPV